MALSPRGEKLAEMEEFLLKYNMSCLHDAFHPIDNPGGYVNMGTASNDLCGDLWMDRLNRPGTLKFEAQMQHYFPMNGIARFRESLAQLFTQQLELPQPMDPNNVTAINGVVASLDACAFCLGAPGDVFLTPTPAYARLFNSCGDRAEVELIGVPLQSHTVPFELTASALEAGVKKQLAKGKRVRAVLIVNPNNPLGEVYSPEIMTDIINMCHKYDLHLLVDEVYAMSVYEKSAPFHSVIKLTLPNPERVHMVWGLSKDFGLAGLRIGVIYTQNKSFLKALRNYSVYQGVPSCVQEMMANVLNDSEWVNSYLNTNRQRLLEASRKTREALESLNVICKPAQAGLFLWADFGQHLLTLDQDGEQEMFQRLYKNKLYIVPGNQLHSPLPGWFRITFAVPPEQLDQGLKILQQVLKPTMRK